LLQCDDVGRAPFVPTDESRSCTVDVRGSHCATRTETVPSGRIFSEGNDSCAPRATLFDSRRFPASVMVQQDSVEMRVGEDLVGVFRHAHIAWVHGGCGSGKSTLVPTSLTQGAKRGMLHILTKKSAAVTLAHWYRNIVPKWWRMAAVWNGDVHEFP
jgi:hypothetical protein